MRALDAMLSLSALLAPPPRRAVLRLMADDEQLGAPSFEAFKKMMERDVSPDKLSVSEQVGRGVSKSWANPAYWSRQFVTAQHIANNVRPEIKTSRPKLETSAYRPP